MTLCRPTRRGQHLAVVRHRGRSGACRAGCCFTRERSRFETQPRPSSKVLQSSGFRGFLSAADRGFGTPAIGPLGQSLAKRLGERAARDRLRRRLDRHGAPAALGHTGRHEPRHVDAIVAAELERALADADPLRGIAQLVARWSAASLLDPDGVTRTRPLGTERMARKLHDALPAGDRSLRTAVWAVLRPILSPRLITLDRDAFVPDVGVESTVDLARHRADAELDELDLGDESADAAYPHGGARRSRGQDPPVLLNWRSPCRTTFAVAHPLHAPEPLRHRAAPGSRDAHALGWCAVAAQGAPARRPA
jgi:hypothetical protein